MQEIGIDRGAKGPAWVESGSSAKGGKRTAMRAVTRSARLPASICHGFFDDGNGRVTKPDQIDLFAL